MKVRSTEVQNNFGKYLELCSDEQIIITKNGKQKALLLPLTETSAATVEEPEPGYHTPAGEYNTISYTSFKELQKNNENRMELIDGDVFVMESPGYLHQKVSKNLLVLLHAFFESNPTCDVFFSPFDVELLRKSESTQNNQIHCVQPDLLVLCDYKDKITADRYKGIPTIVIEILSPSSRSHDMVRKLGLYVESGIREYWIVDPQHKTILIYAIDNYTITDFAVGSEIEELSSFCFPKLTISLKTIFK